MSELEAENLKLENAAKVVKNVINEIEAEEHYKEIIKQLSLFEIIKYKYFK